MRHFDLWWRILVSVNVPHAPSYYQIVKSMFLFVLGPLAGVLANRFGHRTIVMIGGFMSAVGMFASAFATNLYVLYITYGLLAGNVEDHLSH